MLTSRAFFSATLLTLTTLITIIFYGKAWMIWVLALPAGPVWLVLIVGIVVVGLTRLWATCFRHSRCQATPFSALKKLPPHLQYQLEQATPTNQLPLLQEGLLLTLGLLAPLLKTLPSPSGEKDLFTQKVSDLMAVCDAFRQLPRVKSGSLGTRSENNALFAFAFYRTLFSGVLDRANVEDGNLLIKRIPPQLVRFCGAEVYRLYELKTVIDGELDTLSLNADLRDDLKALCQPIASSAMEATMTLASTSEARPAKRTETPPPAETVKAAPKPAPVAKATQAAEAVVAADSDPALAKKFEQWLINQTRHFPVNQGGRFFMKAALAESLFFHHHSLANFAKKCELTVDDCEAALRAANLLSGEWQYCKAGEAPLRVFCTRMLEAITVTWPLAGDVLPVPNEEEH